MKDLTPQLQLLEAKDKLYRVRVKINKILAPQFVTRPYSYRKKGWGEIERVESHTDGTPTTTRAPRRTKRIRTGESEVKQTDCWTFKIVDKKIHLPWGGPWGLFKGALRRSLDAMNKLKYENVRLDLIRVLPVENGEKRTKPCKCGYESCIQLEGPADSLQEDNLPQIVLETRHTQRGDVMVETAFDWIANREFEFLTEIDSECPLNEEKFVGLLKSLNTLDNFGPSKRGSLTVTSIQEVKAS